MLPSFRPSIALRHEDDTFTPESVTLPPKETNGNIVSKYKFLLKSGFLTGCWKVFGLVTLNVAQCRPDEWGLKGAIITDVQALPLYEAEQHLASGLDMVLTASATVYPQAPLDSPGGQAHLRQAAKHILCMEANSMAMDVEWPPASLFTG